ncbi:MAG: AMP-binding protein, partial [Pseudomonadota bacterium]
MTNSLYDALLAKGRSAPERLFAETDDGRIFSYADVDDIAARFAVRLIGCGVQPGDRVAVQVEKSIEALILYLATVRAGAVFLPLNTAYTPAEVTYFIKDAEPALL